MQPRSGLHATLRKRGTQKVEWADVGVSTVLHVENIIKHFQPLTWRLLNKIAGAKDLLEGDPAVRKYHPTNTAGLLFLMSNYILMSDGRSVHML